MSEDQCQNWFTKFRSEKFDIENLPRSRRSVEADESEIKGLTDCIYWIHNNIFAHYKKILFHFDQKKKKNFPNNLILCSLQLLYWDIRVPRIIFTSMPFVTYNLRCVSTEASFFANGGLCQKMQYVLKRKNKELSEWKNLSFVRPTLGSL